MKIRSVLDRLLRRPRAEQDLEEEIRAHLSLDARRQMERGESEEQARAIARRDFGNELLVRESTREQWGWQRLEHAVKDIRLACRTLIKSPGFTAVVVLTLSGGIGAATAIFSVVHAVLLQPLPYREPDRLIALWTSAPSLGLPKAFVSIAEYLDWRAQNNVFEEVGITRPIANFNLTGQGTPERLEGARISETVLPVLGVEPLFGRNFTEQERREDAAVTLLSYGLWQRRFGGDRAVLGRTIQLNGTPHEIVGVMPRGFQYPGRHELWVPLFFWPREVESRIGSNYVAAARLRPGVSIAQARADVERISAALARQYPDTNGKLGAVVEPLDEAFAGSVRTPLLAVFAAVAALLLIACANIAGLLLTRAAGRLREFSLRTALGASRGRITAQLLAEIVPLAFLGAAGGIALARVMLYALIPLLPPEMPRVETVGLDLTVLAFAVGISTFTAAATVLVPAIHAGGPDLTRSLKEDARTLAGGRSGLRNILVIGQVAVSLALVLCSGLLLESLNRVSQIRPGFDTHGVLTMHLAIPRTRYSSDREVARYCWRLVEAVKSTPGVESVGMVNRLPLSGVAQTLPIEFEGIDTAKAHLGNIDSRVVTPEYFRAIGIPLLRGRTFTDADTEEDRPVGLIDEQLASRIFPNQDPLGRKFRIGVKNSTGPWTEIIGIVGHIRNDSLEVDARPQIYWSQRQRAQDRMVLGCAGIR